MSTNMETELKLRLTDPDEWDSIFYLPLFGGAEEMHIETLEAQYFDTPTHALQQARMAYRIRREGGAWIATVKGGGSSGGGLHQREEWNVHVAEPIPGIEPFQTTSVGFLLQELVGNETLEPLFTTRFERRKLDLHMPDGSLIELSADKGEIIAGNKREPILELELELKEGCPAALLKLGAELARQIPLSPESRSKYHRALKLADLISETGSQETELTQLTGDEVPGEALTDNLIEHLHQVLVAQDIFLQKPDDPETLHQLRIKLRRLRAMLSFAKPLTDEEGYATQQEILRQWGRELGELREIDVLVEAWNGLIERNQTYLGGKPWLGELLAELRQEKLTVIQSKLAGGQSTPLLLDFWAWLAGGALCVVMPEENMLADFARKRLSLWFTDIIKIGKEPDISNGVAMHHLRVQAKKIRYVLENLTFLLDGRNRKVVNKLKELQDSLGYVRDTQMIVHAAHTIIATRSSRALYRDAGLLIGWQARGDIPVRRNFMKQWKRIRRIARKCI